MFEQQKIEHDLRVALTLKADDLWFTVGGERGRQLQAEFLGVEPLNGLAGESFDEDSLCDIDLSRFAVAGQAAELAETTSNRSWGPEAGEPDTEDHRNYILDFFEHFLSTLPTVALGGEDSTNVGYGILRDLYLTSYAWFGLVDAVADVFRDLPQLYSIRLSDIARLSGRELRTIRNQAGPTKPLRTTAERQLRRQRTINDPAFVTVNTFDAVDWLRRRGFEFQPLSLDWGRRRMAEAVEPATKARSLLMLALINFGPRWSIASTLSCDEDQVRRLEDGDAPLAADDEQALRTAINL